VQLFFTPYFEHYIRQAQRLMRHSSALSTTTITYSGIVCSIVAALSTWLTPLIGLVVLGVVVVPVLVLLFVRHPRYWLYAVVASLWFWFPQKGDASKGITALEYVLVAWYFGGLGIWFFVMMFVRRRRLVYHTGDILLLCFFGISVFNLGIALANDVSPMQWLREWLLFLFILYYFPLREHFRTLREWVVLSVVFTLTMTAIGAVTIQRYIAASSNVVYAFQILTSRLNSNNNMTVAVSIMAAIGALYYNKTLIRVLLLSVAGFFATLTIISFARMFMLATAVSIVGALLLVDTRRVVGFLAYSAILAIVFVGTVSLVFQSRATIALKVFTTRISSTAAGTKDLSLRSRISESRVIASMIQTQPIAGYGLGAGFSFYDPITNTTLKPTFIHNGYLFIAFKLGFVLWVLLYAGLTYYLARSYACALQAQTPLEKMFAVGAMSAVFALLVINLTSSIFEVRDGFIMLALLLASISIAERDMQNAWVGEQRDRVLASTEAPNTFPVALSTVSPVATSGTRLCRQFAYINSFSLVWGTAAFVLLTVAALAFFLWQVRV
jgi:O-antigen ligase